MTAARPGPVSRPLPHVWPRPNDRCCAERQAEPDPLQTFHALMGPPQSSRPQYQRRQPPHGLRLRHHQVRGAIAPGVLSLCFTRPAALSRTCSSDKAGRVTRQHSCSSRLRSCDSTRIAACRPNPSLLAHREVCNKFWLARRSVRRWSLFDPLGARSGPRACLTTGHRWVTVTEWLPFVPAGPCERRRCTGPLGGAGRPHTRGHRSLADGR
jgi:hypothetical protein